MRRYGLIGKPLSHSFSPGFFAQFFKEKGIDASNSYEAFELQSVEEVEELFQNPEIQGLNVTIPFKESVLPFVEYIDSEAQEVGAINTLVRQKSSWKAYNTDIIGIDHSLDLLQMPKKVKAVILGSGGASKAVRHVLYKRGIPFELISRSGAINYENVKSSLFKENKLIINCTPLGMFPNINSYPPIPYSVIDYQYFAFDLVYNPSQTIFLNRCKENGAKCLNGLPMLESQALASWQLWEKAFQV